METLRIIQVAHAFPPYPGGLSHVVEMLSRNLIAHGHDVEIVTLDPSGRLKKSDSFEGALVRRFRAVAPSNCYFFPSPRVISYLRSVRADIIHAHGINALLVPACWWAIRNRLMSISFVLSTHHHLAGSTWHTKMLWRLYDPFAGRIVRSARKIHCVSSYEARLVKEQFGCNPLVIQNGVAEDTFQYNWNPPSGGLVLTYAGRLERYKRVHVLIEAASILLRRKHEVVVRIIGDGPELSNLLTLSNRLGVKVQHFHFLDRRQYLELLSTSSFFINPSRYEAFSIVVAEAKTIGLPVVVSLPWGEIFRDLPSVLLVDGNSPQEIAEAVSKIVDSRLSETDLFMSWNEVTNRIVREVYIPSLNRS